MQGAITRWLVILGVLLCSMHLAEPATAHETQHGEALHLATDKTDGDRQEPASAAVHGGHHHCPVAPDLRAAAADDALSLSRGLLFAARPSRLTSRAPPPLLDPPLA